MYQVHYLAPTAGGDKKEHILEVGSLREYEALIKRCMDFGYTVMRNPMCEKCIMLGGKCNGTKNWIYTGCVYREVVA